MEQSDLRYWGPRIQPRGSAHEVRADLRLILNIVNDDVSDCTCTLPTKLNPGNQNVLLRY